MLPRRYQPGWAVHSRSESRGPVRLDPPDGHSATTLLHWLEHMYRYDLFVSYKREPSGKRLVTPWLREVLNRIEYWVGQDMGGLLDHVWM